MDDIISAVDRNVAKHIFQNCLLGMLSKRTRILCTHHTQYLVHCDWLVVLDNGNIIKQGKPSEVLDDYEEFLLPSDLEQSENLDKMTQTLDESEDDVSLMNQEGRETGSVQFDVYGSYWKAMGHLLSLSILISIILMQTSRNMTDWWLSYWVSSTSGNNTNTINVTQNYVLFMPNTFDGSIKYYMTIYGIFVGMNSLFTLFRAFLFAYGGVRAATKIHKTLLKVILKVIKISFY